MNLSIFTDELGLDITEGLPHITTWGLRQVDLRNKILGRAAEALDAGEMKQLKALLDNHQVTVGCLESSLAKCHLPGPERVAAEMAKLDNLIRLADAVDCRLVRSFHFWQPSGAERGSLATDEAALQRVVELFSPFAEKARAAGLTLAFENCGVADEEVFAVLETLAIDDFALAWDVSNSWACEARQADLEGYLADMAPRAKLLHVKAIRCVPGLHEETIPWARVLQVAQAAGLAGPVSVETHNPDKTISDLEMSRRVVERIQAAWPA